WSVTEDSLGRLWAVSNDGLSVIDRPLSQYAMGELPVFADSLPGVVLPRQSIEKNAIAPHPDGSIWVGVKNEGLLRFRTAEADRSIADTLAADEIRGADIQAIGIQRDGTAWIALSDHRLLVIGDDFRVIGMMTEEDGLPPSPVRSLIEDKEGRMLAGCIDGSVLRITGDSRPTVTVLSRLLSSEVSSIAVDRRNRIWVASQGSGVLQIDADGRERILTRENGLLSEVAYAVTEDREGNIWIAQTGGVAKLRPNYEAFLGFTSRSFRGEPPILPASAVSAVVPAASRDARCRIWAGTSDGGLACIEAGGSSSHITERDGLLSDWINALHLDEDNQLWIGTLRGASRMDVAEYERSGRIRIDHFGGATVRSVSSLMLDAEHAPLQTLWFGAVQSVNVRLGSEWFILRDEAGLPPLNFQAAAVDSAGHVWLGSRENGLFRSRKPLSVELLRNAAGRPANLSRGGSGDPGKEITEPMFERVQAALPSQHIESILPRDRHLWIGTSQGLILLDGSGEHILAVLDRTSGMPADNVVSTALSSDGSVLWAGTNQGLVAIDAEQASVKRVLTQQDGLVNNEVWFYGSVASGSDGSVYFGTANGLSIYRPEYDVPNERPPELRIRRASITQSIGRSNEATFDYTALTFADEKRVSFRTRLVGYDSEWSSPKSDRSLRYTNLPAVFFPKTYRFEVTASNESGVWAVEPASLTFDVSPPWWLRWWAIGGYFVALAVGVVVVHRFQHVRLVRRAQEEARLREAELRAQTSQAKTEAAEARAQALMAENDRKALALAKARELEKAYYELKSAQTQLVQAEKMASLGRLAAGIAHEIKNPLNFINNFAALSVDLLEEVEEILADEDLPQDVREELDDILSDLRLNTGKIVEHGKRTDGIVRSMLMHSRGKTGEASPVEVNSLVEEYVNLAYHGMRAEHSDFNTEIVRDLDAAAGHATMFAQEIGRVLINLLNNAFYAVHQRGKAEPGFEPRVEVATRRIDDVVRIRVRDNGTGIPDSVRERIFEPFFTTKPTG
ncbi:MAG: two-component regulator propeller domain-containing protein, partial [Bacteroidota bacterium]